MSESRTNSIRKLIILVFAACVTVFFFLIPEFASQDQTTVKQEAEQSSAADLVKLYVSVVDKTGRLVSKLNYYDFEIYCDKIPQQISYFSKKDEPVGVVFLVNMPGPMGFLEMPDSTSHKSIYKSLIATIPHFIENSNRVNEYSIVSINQQARSPRGWIRNRDEIEKSLSDLLTIQHVGQISLYDPIIAAIEQAKSSAYPKRAIVLLSDGMGNASPKEMNQLGTALLENNIPIYSIAFNPDFFSLKNHFARGSASMKVTSKQLFTDLTSFLGGTAFFPLNQEELIGSFDKVVEEIRHQYVLGFKPTCDHTGSKPRHINVRLAEKSALATDRKMMTIRHREMYGLTLNKQ